VPEPQDVILVLSGTDPKVEELGISIAFTEVADSRSLVFARSFQSGEAFDLTFEIGAEPSFLLRERARFLGDIQLKNDVEGQRSCSLQSEKSPLLQALSPSTVVFSLWLMTWTG
jgi:hypothetical protein